MPTDDRISIAGGTGTGGAYRIGDTVTATWDNSSNGDNQPNVTSVAVDFSQFGGGLIVAATNVGDVWTASYMITAGAIDAINHNIKITATDTDGTSTRFDTTNATVDNVAPFITFGDLLMSNDTGTSSTDFITKTSAQSITATLSSGLAAGDFLYGSLDNGATWTELTAKNSGTSLLWDGVTLASGSNTLQFKVVDKVGNDGLIASQAYTLDTTAPAATSIPTLATASDSGVSNSDGITAVATPSITGTAEANASVTLYDTDGTTVLGSSTANGSGLWSITSSALNSGSHTLTATAIDVAGNVGVSSSSLSVTIDTAAPTGMALSTSQVSVSAATSGARLATISAIDATTVTYALATGNGTNDADNGRFALVNDTLQVGGAGLAAGTYHLNLSAKDAAGNVSYLAQDITVQDNPSVASIARAGGVASGVSASESDIAYTVSFSQAVTGVDVTDFTLARIGTASGTIASVAGSGTTYTVTVNDLGGDGVLRLDLNGSGTGISNESGGAILSGFTSGQTYTLDHTAPAAPTMPMLNVSSDSGASSFDGITSVAQPNLTGLAEPNATVRLYDTNGTTVLGSAVANGSGAWSITSTTLTSGTHTLTAKAVDIAGNVSGGSPSRTIVIDTTGPVVAIASPSEPIGALTQTIAGTVTDANAVGTAVTLREGSTVLGTATVQADRSWSASVDFGTYGAHTLTASNTDLAGNTGQSQLIYTIAAPATPNDPSIGGTASPGAGQTQTLSNVSSGSVTLDGPGTLVLTGANTYTGPTTVNAGTLLVNGSIVSPVSVGSGATLGGSGSTGTVSIGASGTLSPGNSPGILSTKDLSLAAGAVLKEEIGGTATGQFDQVKVVGSVSLGGATLSTTAFNGFNSVRGNSFAIIDNDGTDAVSGTFAGLAENATLNLGGRSLRISYHGGDGNDVVLTDVTGNAAVFGRVETSAASTAGAVYGLYEAILDRAPDPYGLQTFTTAVRAGASLTDVATALLGSGEHAGRPSTGSAYVESLYANVLNRSADTGGLAAYTGALASGTSSAAVAVQLATSGEAQSVLKSVFDAGVSVPDAGTSAVARLYYGLLNRAPDTTGLQSFAGQVAQAVSTGGTDGGARALAGVAGQIMGSNEYAFSRSNLTDANFVDSVYLSALGRRAEAAGSAFWADQLSHGVSRAVVATQIAESAEAQVYLVGQIEVGQYLLS